jgi:hypothetical protein
LVVAVSISGVLVGLKRPPVSGEEFAGPQHRPIDNALADEFADTVVHLAAEAMDALLALAEIFHT